MVFECCLEVDAPEMNEQLKAAEGDLNYERVKTRIEEALQRLGRSNGGTCRLGTSPTLQMNPKNR